MDIFADKAVESVINRIIYDDKSLYDNVAVWKSMTRLMFQNYPAIAINNWIQEISEEAYDEEWFEKKYSQEEFVEKFVTNLRKEKEKKRELTRTNDRKKALINSRLKITDIAKEYGLDVDKKGKCMCPFHEDSDPSMSLDDSKNIFHCFGCNRSGNIIKFYSMLKKLDESKT